MKSANRVLAMIAGSVLLLYACGASAQDWPQWRGPNRDAKTAGFNAPATWPATLAKKWDVPVGEGDSSPALVGDRLYVFGRQDGNEVTRCLNTATGDEIWNDSYEAGEVAGPDARGHSGPRSSPVVADGRLVTLGVRGVLSCLDAATGEVKWRKDEFAESWPRFHVSSSPVIVDGMCIAQLGGDQDGTMIAYDLATGDVKWRAPIGTPAYGSPVLMTIDGTKVVIAATNANLVGVNAADGKEVWRIQYRHTNYNAVTPIVNGQTLLIAGPGQAGMTALKLAKQGDGLTEEEVWNYADNNLAFNTPVLKDSNVFGLSNGDRLFCINADGSAGWDAPLAAQADVGQMAPGQNQTVFAQQRGEGRGQGTRRGRGQRRGRRGGGMGGGGYGSIVDAGSVLLALSPAADLVVFRPSNEAFTEVARYKLSDGGTYAYPIASGNRIYVKDQDSVSMWTVE